MVRVASCWVLLIFWLQDLQGGRSCLPLPPLRTSMLQYVSSDSVNPTRDMNITKTCGCGMDAWLFRIVNGQETVPHAYPWMAALYLESYFLCGGVLINDRYILTAGHCTIGIRKEDVDYVRVRLGLHDKYSHGNGKDGYTRKIKRIITHPDYYETIDETIGNDIALMELEEPIAQLTNVGQICLPLERENLDLAGYDATVAGWGRQEPGGISSQFLRETTVKIMSNEACQSFESDFISEIMLCAAKDGTDACQGDSGGPLFMKRSGRYEQIGIVSWGIGCADPIHPGVYTRVSAYLDWIIENTKNAVYCSSGKDQRLNEYEYEYDLWDSS